jgi:hypothetical protein
MELSTGRIFMKLAGAAEQLIGQNSSGMKGKAA